MSINDYIIWEKEFNLEKVFNGVSTHHFWHCDNQLFDVEFYYRRDLIAMISYSKSVKGHWWEQRSDFNKKWDPYNYLDNNKKLIFLSKKRREMKEKFLDIANKIYEKNKLNDANYKSYLCQNCVFNPCTCEISTK